MARISIEGRLAAEPIRREHNEKIYVHFRVLENNGYYDNQGEWVETDPEGFDLVATDKLAERVVESLRTGDPVLIDGETYPHSWTEKETGEKRTVQRVRARSIGASLRYGPVLTSRVFARRRGQLRTRDGQHHDQVAERSLPMDDGQST